MDCLVIAERSKALAELCGLSVFERSLRTLQACGVTRAFVLSDDPGKLPASPRAKLELVFSAPPDDGQLRLAIRGDCVFDQRLLRALLAQDRPTALIDSAAPGSLCGAAFLSCDEVTFSSFEDVLRAGLEGGGLAPLDVAAQPSFQNGMHREIPPYWLPTPNRAAAKVILDAAQKGTLDLPAMVHAPIETFLVSQLCKFSITPNQLTFFCNLVAWSATLLFATGHLAAGILTALAVGVLDGLDGKLARVKLEVSKAGELEHFFDLLFENSWWIALAYSWQSTGQLPGAYRYLCLLLAAEVLAKLARSRIESFYGKAIGELGRFERVIRLIGARRNVDIWILAAGLLLQHPARAFILVAWWEALTAAAHLPRAARTFWRGHANAPRK